ncbi:uncharacterized protein LOC127718650 [Mytilus californianus]|uniref:uncharacterized protein LOC127718650 n=1 Tax=Mytilus californianus TaxID=6549 RepID=UPI0022470115|nr:uncharacterized protein LOC127718650 [Mytilus californianus]
MNIKHLSRTKINKANNFFTGKPIVLDSTQKIFYGIIDNQTDICLEVYSVPKFTEIQLQDSNGVILNRQGKVTITDETAVFRQKFHSKLIRLNGYRLKIRFSTFSEKDVGNYSMNIDNSYGKDTTNLTIQVASPPNIPMNVSIKPLVNAVIVNWHKNFDGGFEQTFYIEFKIESKRNWISVKSFNTTPSAEVSWQISGLRSSQTYFFRMFARNSLGESSKTDIQIIQTKGIGHNEGGMLIIYAVISSAAVVSTMILSAVLYYCIRSRRSCEETGNTSRAVTIDSPNIYDEIPSDNIPENIVPTNNAEVHDESMIISEPRILVESQVDSHFDACESQSKVYQVNDDYLHPCVKGQSESDSCGSGSGDLQINPHSLDLFAKRQSAFDSGSCSSGETPQGDHDYLHPYVSLQPNWKENSKDEGLYMQQIK